MTKPTPIEIGAYGISIGLPAEECEWFYDHFAANGWKIAGKAPMKDWQAAMRNWYRRWKARQMSRDGSGRIGSHQTTESIWALKARLKAHRGNPEHIAFSKSSPEEKEEFRVLLAKFEQSGGGSLHG